MKLVIATIALSLLTACIVGDRNIGSGGASDTGETGVDPATTPPATDESPGVSRGTGGATIEGIPLTFTMPQPNVMLLVDRSCSMSEVGACEGSACARKWDQLLALGGYLGEVKQRSRLGLSVYPTTSSCGVRDSNVVPLSSSSDVDQRILDALASAGPNGGTPTAFALDELRYSGVLEDEERESFVVLLTDGMPNCGCAANDVFCERDLAVAAVRNLAQATSAEIYVIGFGASVGSLAGETLAAMSLAAGTARPGPGPAWYPAQTIEELIEMLYRLTIRMQPCEFVLQRAVEGELSVTLDGEALSECSGPCDAGYVYDEARLRVSLRGESCEVLRDGGHHELWFADN